MLNNFRPTYGRFLLMLSQNSKQDFQNCITTLVQYLLNRLCLFFLRFDKKHITVRFLEHDRSTGNESAHYDRQIKWIHKHKGYSSKTFNNDIALIRLEKPVIYDEILRPVCLPPKGKWCSFLGLEIPRYIDYLSILLSLIL